jgi:hypothetical protein
MRRSSYLIIAFICLFALVGCSSVTERGNSLPQLPSPQPHASPILGPASGVGSKTLTVSSRFSLLYYLVSCSGARLVTVKTTQGTFGVSCNNGSVVAGDSFIVTKRDLPRVISVRIIAPSNAAWELRVDGSDVNSTASN